MTIQYKTKGVCSQRIDVTVDNSIIKKVEFVGGCAGIGKLAGIRCGFKATSCPDQLAKALTIALAEEEKRKQGA